MRYFVVLFIILLCGFSLVNGQSVKQVSFRIDYDGYETKHYNGNDFDFPTSLSLMLDSLGMPVFRAVIPLENRVQILDVQVDTHSLDLTPIGDASTGARIDSLGDIRFSYSVVYDGGQPFIEVLSNVYFVKNNIVKALESIDVKYTYSHGKELKSLKSADAFKANSVLSQGKWVKVQIAQSGIFQLDYGLLASWGFNNPQKVKIYGNGGSMLPRTNSDFRYDDLVENPCLNTGEALLFYGKAGANWSYNSIYGMYLYELNKYDSYSYYYITESDETSKQLTTSPSDLTHNLSVNTFDHYDYHEQNSVNLIKSGSQWVGDEFSTASHTFERLVSFNTPNLDQSQLDGIKLSINLLARSDTNSSFEVYTNDNINPDMYVYCYKVILSSNTERYADEQRGLLLSSDYKDVTRFKIKYNAPNNVSLGWINSMAINARTKLVFNGNQIGFRNHEVAGFGNLTQFRVSGATNRNIQIWDVTNPVNPVNMATTTSFDTIRFVASTDTLREFVAFDLKQSFPSPQYVGSVENQNLHGYSDVDYVIVTPEEFLAQAKELAEIHKQYNGLNPLVVTTNQIYNEFSSGKQDPIAIRSFMRMLYKKADGDLSKTPKYLLLYGDGSYDNIGINPKNKSKVVTFQSDKSFHQTESYVTDDVMGFLDDSEGGSDVLDKLDIGIGRFVINTVQEAKDANNKVLAYLRFQEKGEWQSRVTFLAQDEDNNLHQGDAESLAIYLRANYPEINLNKIYADSYQKVSNSQFSYFPDADKAIHEALVSEGSMIFNYTGHGAVNRLNYDFLTIPKVDALNNIKRLPLYLTATCEISRFDNPDEISMGERVFLNPIGGGIGLLSTTRVVYSTYNKNLNLSFYKNAFLKDSTGLPLRIGDIMRRTKNGSLSTINKLNFFLLCDPGLRLCYPARMSDVTEIKNVRLNQVTDTISALTHGKISGEVHHLDGSLDSTYNGKASITLYDKIQTLKTLGNDGQVPFQYEAYQNILFRGEGAVENGVFSAEFIVPKDIRYDFGKGKISLFTVSDDSVTTLGVNSSIVIGDVDPLFESDDDGPEISLFLNNTSFVSGGKTGLTPLFLAYLNDENSINTSGAGIGHDLMMVLDDDPLSGTSMNGYFKFNQGSYTAGKVVYQLPTLSPGIHTISLKAWDCNNNSSFKTLSFEVVRDDDLSIENVSIYPNPINEGGTLKIVFNHDEPNSTFQFTLEVFGMDGSKVTEKQFSRIDFNGNLPVIEWTPLTSSGTPLREGVYILRLTTHTSTEQNSVFSKRFVVIR